MATLSFALSFDTTAAPFESDAALDGTTYVLRVYYVLRDEAWYVDLLDATGDAIVAGQPLVDGWPLFSLHKRTDPRVPQGDMWRSGASLVYVEAS